MLERMDAPDALALCLVDIGSVYAEQNETRTALQHFERARDLYKQLNYQEEEAMALSHCANIYNRSGDPDCKLSPAECARAGKIKALDDLLLALDMWTKTKQDGGVAGAAANIAMIYRDLGNLEEAHRYAQLSLQVSEKLNFNLGLVRAERTYADIVLLEGKTKEAETYAMRSLQLSKQMGLPDAIMSAALVLKKVYEKQHNYKAALEMQELYTRMNDSINNESTRKESIKTQFRIAYERQAEKDSVANAVRITEEQLKSEQKIAEQRTYTIAGIIGFLLMLAVAVISLRAYRAKRKANRRITEQNEQIAMNNKDLERQHLLNQKIFSVISHDFRGPILSLNMVLDKFKSSSDDPKLNRYLSDTGTAVRNANEVLNNLLNWAKTEISISGVDKTEVKVRSIVSEIRKELAAKLEEKQLRIVENIPIDSMINLPPDILRIVLRNLVSNAIKFSYAGNSIELSFDAAWQKLSVKDSGAGMSPETAAQLFRRQVNPEQGTHLEEGFGIGLYIVSELLYKYGFTISVTSSIGKGATFAVEPATAK
jgi:signal transduction histidine kinase